jgi:hypothetical protein
MLFFNLTAKIVDKNVLHMLVKLDKIFKSIFTDKQRN